MDMKEHDFRLFSRPLTFAALGACNCSTLTSCVRERGGENMKVGHGPSPAVPRTRSTAKF